MGHHSSSKQRARTPIGKRASTHGVAHLLEGLTRENLPAELIAGVTLLAIAIPEQLATSQLAGVPAFTAMIAFISATVVFTVLGSNPIMSIGADSTIAPLFAVALTQLAASSSPAYLSLVATTAVVTGVILSVIGLLRLGWLADFLSMPIVTGFLSGIGVIIIVHQLPRALGVNATGASIISRLESMSHHLGHVSYWSLTISLATVAIMVLGEHFNPRLPMALVAVLGATALSSAFSLEHHGVEALGSVIAGAPTWRLHWLGLHQWGVVVTTALTLVVVIMSQTAATGRVSADELGVADDMSRDYVGVGVGNIVAGLVGAFPVDASPARTTVVGLAGGRTRLVGVVAVVLALALSPLAAYAHAIPLCALAGVLFFVAGRLIKVEEFVRIARTNRVEFAVALFALLAVVVLGVELGLAFAVGLAILARTWRSSRPQMYELGRARGSTSWEPLEAHAVEPVDHLLAILFAEALYFANAGVFRHQLHALMAKYPATRHLVIDAVAMGDVDYTGLVTLARIVADLRHDHVSVGVARASDAVRARLSASDDPALADVKFFDSVDAAARDALGD